MREQLLALPTADGVMETFLTHPTGELREFPAVILYMDIWGLREELYDIARRIATVGYCCLVPDLFYRFGRIRWTFTDAHGKATSFTRLSEEQKVEVLGPLQKLTDAMVIRDTQAILRVLSPDSPAGVKVGCLGYCMGGRHALRAASALPEQVRAAACLHGTSLMTDQPDSPHRAAAGATGEIYCGFGELDPDGSRETVEAFAESMRHSRATYSFARHANAEHGYALPDRDVYDKRAANEDWEAIFRMFRRQLAFEH